MMHSDSSASVAKDKLSVKTWMSDHPDTEKVAGFVPGPGIQKLDLHFDLARLQQDLSEVLTRTSYQGDMQDEGFAALPMTRRPRVEQASANDLSGRYWLRADDRYVEEAMEELVDEAAFSELDPIFSGTYFEEVHKALTARFTIGRVRILSKGLYNCNSWHRDPEPRLHIPIHSNPGSLFIVNNHCTHLPADGSVYFTDTRGYHTALNGGLHHRVHLVAALVP
ncbi:hypothetical protein ACTL6U_08180 [Rhodovibrionaceae bacterium A322]